MRKSNNEQLSQVKAKGLSRDKKKYIFVLCVLALPIIQFCIFYIYVNFNSIIMAFTKYVPTQDKTGYTMQFSGFENFVTAFKSVFVKNSYMIWNSLLSYGCSLIIGMTLELLFAFYIYKEFFFSKLFRVILFIPQIVSSVVFVLLFKFIVEDVYREVFNQTMGLLANPDTRMATLILYSILIGFGVNVVMFTGAMSGIDVSIVESAKLDGVNYMQEFLHITFPMIYPTFTTFIIVGLSALFTNQLNLFTFFGSQSSAYSSSVSTVGFFLYVQALDSDLFVTNYNILTYPELAALGLLLTAVTFPIVLIVKKQLAKFGPSTN